MSILADIRYALRMARAERYIEEQLDKYENELIRWLKDGTPYPLVVAARGGWDDVLNDKEWDRLDTGRQALHDRYSEMAGIK